MEGRYVSSQLEGCSLTLRKPRGFLVECAGRMPARGDVVPVVTGGVRAMGIAFRMPPMAEPNPLAGPTPRYDGRRGSGMPPSFDEATGTTQEALRQLVLRPVSWGDRLYLVRTDK